MNTLDIIYAFIMVVSLAISAFRGGVRELFSLGAVVVGFIAAANFYQFGSGQILQFTSHKDVNNIISFILIFLFVSLLISYVGGQLTQLVKKANLGFWDLMAGTALGAFKGLFVCALSTYMLLVFMKPTGGFFSGSKAFPYMAQASVAISPIGPGHFKKEFTKKLDELYEKTVPKATGMLKPDDMEEKKETEPTKPNTGKQAQAKSPEPAPSPAQTPAQSTVDK